jgi:hypothetical protein
MQLLITQKALRATNVSSSLFAKVYDDLLVEFAPNSVEKKLKQS